jgi:dephospho-CoA kinase
MMIVALTGGIGSGKSTVSDRFAALGVPVIDTDVIAREQVLPGSPALEEIRSAFGPVVFAPDGTLDRARLRELVFDVPDKRRQLERILHPRILAEMDRRIRALDAPYAIVVIPLLLETDQTSMADRILVVDCAEALQIARVRERSGLNKNQIRRILTAQIDRASRLVAADDVIENNGSLDELIAAVDRLHESYLLLASDRK